MAGQFPQTPNFDPVGFSNAASDQAALLRQWHDALISTPARPGAIIGIRLIAADSCKLPNLKLSCDTL